MKNIEPVTIKKRNKKTNYDKLVALRISSTVYTMLERVSKRKGLKFSKLVRRVLNKYAFANTEYIEQITNIFIDMDFALLVCIIDNRISYYYGC